MYMLTLPARVCQLHGLPEHVRGSLCNSLGYDSISLLSATSSLYELTRFLEHDEWSIYYAQCFLCLYSIEIFLDILGSL